MDLHELLTPEAETPQEERTVYEFFKWSVILKGLISIAEIIVGLVLFVIPFSFLLTVIEEAKEGTIAYIPPTVAHILLQELSRVSAGTVIFIAIYLISRGFIKSFLIWALLKSKLWAYPSSLIVLGLFVLYQVYQIATEHSVSVIAITLFDLVVMYFIWREWKIVQRHAAP